MTLSQNDAGKGVDAPDFFANSLNITPGSYKDTLYSNQTLNVTDTDDFYGVDYQVGNHICVTMTPPADADFDLILKNPSGQTKNMSKLGIGQTERVTYTADVAGKWRILIYWAGTGEGQYSFSVNPPCALTFKTRKLTGTEITGVNVKIDNSWYLSPVTVYVDGGAHVVRATFTFSRGMFVYTFDHWEDGSTANPRNITVYSDMTVTAYYDYEYVGTCPTLFVWNGTDYAYETLLNIHAESDITLDHKIQQPLVRDGLFYKLQLQELDEFTSHIDQVKLYAVDFQGNAHVCALVIAKKGDTFVTLTLLLDDENRVDLMPSEVVDLKFIPSIPQRLTAYFVFEINGYNRKIE